jgi:hypothetical protein
VLSHDVVDLGQDLVIPLIVFVIRHSQRRIEDSAKFENLSRYSEQCDSGKYRYYG